MLDDWRTFKTREMMTERVKKLDGSINDSLNEMIKNANYDSEALERDWEQLRSECLYMTGPGELRIVRDALKVAYAAHSGQNRKSGEPYVVHCVQVASLLAALQMDVDTVAAGLLHDTVEDTSVTFEQLEARYGVTLRKIVEGETKVSKLPKLASAAVDDVDHENRRTKLQQQPQPQVEEDEEEEVPTSFLYAPPPRHIVDDEELALSVKSKGDDEANASTTFNIPDEQAENLRQMFVAMTDDYRIIIVKLADRLHNMRTLEHMTRPKQVKIARETLEIFAPLAHRLGIWQFKSELEEIAFRYAHPGEHETLRLAIDQRRQRFDDALQGTKAELERSFAADESMKGVSVAVSGRSKELYSLWLKLRKMAAATTDVQDTNHHFDVDAVQDVVALRVVLDVPRLSADEPVEAWRERSVWLCYRALSLVQHLDQCEVEQGVKDYISFPKPNGYQSLHVFVKRKPEDQIVEIQIRTKWMHEIAEHGMAAHWVYKESFFSPRVNDNSNQYAVTWLDSVKTWQHEIRSPREFIDTIRRELLGKRVFVFLRDGKILDLSRGATALDAAFHIHTDVGLKAVAAHINGREVQFSYELRNGDVVDIQTAPDARPQLDWMRWAHRRSTRSKLRTYFKQQERIAKENNSPTTSTSVYSNDA